jgi:hypothetical protein
VISTSGPRQLSVHGYLALGFVYKDSKIYHSFVFGSSYSIENFESQGKFVGVFDLGRMTISHVMQAAAQGLTQITYCLFLERALAHTRSILKYLMHLTLLIFTSILTTRYKIKVIKK